MVKPLNGKPTTCTITGHCQTFVFRFPGFLSDRGTNPSIIGSSTCTGGLKASVVSDLPAYFEQEPIESPHYSHRTYLCAPASAAPTRRPAKRANRPPHPEVPLFVVIEEYAEVPPTVLNSGECFTIDECRDGEGHDRGRQGRQEGSALPSERATVRGPTSMPTCLS